MCVIDDRKCSSSCLGRVTGGTQVMVVRILIFLVPSPLRDLVNPPLSLFLCAVFGGCWEAVWQGPGVYPRYCFCLTWPLDPTVSSGIWWGQSAGSSGWGHLVGGSVRCSWSRKLLLLLSSYWTRKFIDETEKNVRDCTITLLLFYYFGVIDNNENVGTNTRTHTHTYCLHYNGYSMAW